MRQERTGGEGGALGRREEGEERQEVRKVFYQI